MLCCASSKHSSLPEQHGSLVPAASALLLTLDVLLGMNGLITALVSLLVQSDPLGLTDQAPRGLHVQVDHPHLFLQTVDEGG